MFQLFATRTLARSLVAFVLLVAGFAPAAALAQESRFDVLEFEIEGNTVLPALAIERAVYPFLGPGKTIDDVQGARAALEKAYQEAGYLTVVVDVPPQQVKDGKVILAVTEATIDKLAVTGNRFRSRDYIRSKFPSLAPGSVPYFPDAQKDLVAFSRIPKRSATPVLKPGAATGTVGMELRVQEDNPLSGSVEVNNRQAINTEPLRVQGIVSYGNLWGRDHTASLLYLTAPQNTDQVSAISANYLIRPVSSSHSFAFFAVRSRSTVATLGSANIVGDGNVYGVRAILPLPGDESFSHSVVYGVDYKESFQGIGLTPGVRVEGNVSYTPLTALYSMTRRGQKGITRATVQGNLLMRGALLGNRDDEFAARRLGATANYAVLRAEVAREQTLPRNFSALAKFTAHTSSQPLINTELFFASGASGVRGYFEGEVAGDDGWLASVELRTPSLLSPGEGPGTRELVAVGFVDAATVRNKAPLPAYNQRDAPWSWGVGLRYKAAPSLSATVEVGVPMVDVRLRPEDPGAKPREPRLHLRLAYDF